MPATKKTAKKSAAKSASKTAAKNVPVTTKVTKKNSAVPIIHTKMLKSAEDGQTVSPEFADKNPLTTYALSVERPLAGAALKQHQKTQRKAVAKKTAASKAPPAKKAAPAKAAPAAKKAVTKTASHPSPSKALKTAKKATAARGHAKVSEIASIAKPIAKAIVNAVHAAAVQETHVPRKTAPAAIKRAASARAISPMVTQRTSGMNQSTQPFGSTPAPVSPARKSGTGPFHPEAVRDAIASPTAEVHEGLKRSAQGLF